MADIGKNVCMSTCTLVRNYGTTTVAPIQRDQPFLSPTGESIAKHIYGLGMNQTFVTPKPRTIVLARCSSNTLDWIQVVTVIRIRKIIEDIIYCRSLRNVVYCNKVTKRVLCQ
jgi:hypothetical protein